MGKDYYKILNVDRNATKEDIKKSYRQLALKYHPDRNQGDGKSEEKFKEASEAYSVLGDEEKRKTYDQYGIEGLKGNQAGYGGFGNFSDLFSSSIFSDFEDILGNFFGFSDGFSNSRWNAPRRGEDIYKEVTLTMKEAYLGVEKEIEIFKSVKCDRCLGEGSEPGTKPENCSQCNGSGTIRRSQGFFSISSTCHACRGSGLIIKNPCQKCDGNQLIKIVESKIVTIPAGIDKGNKIRISGAGEEGLNKGRPGDLYLIIDIKSDEGFRREGNDLIYELPISFSQAVFGDEVIIDTYGGSEKIKITAKTQSGDTLVIKNKGFKNINRWGKGNLVIIFKLITPTQLSKRETQLFKELRDIEKEKKN